MKALEQKLLDDLKHEIDTYGKDAVELMRLQPLNMFVPIELQVLHKLVTTRQEENVDE